MPELTLPDGARLRADAPDANARVSGGNFGVYARVAEPRGVRAGDAAELLAASA